MQENFDNSHPIFREMALPVVDLPETCFKELVVNLSHFVLPRNILV